jgi:hypothetical protein
MEYSPPGMATGCRERASLPLNAINIGMALSHHFDSDGREVDAA